MYYSKVNGWIDASNYIRFIFQQKNMFQDVSCFYAWEVSKHNGLECFLLPLPYFQKNFAH